MSKRIEPKYCIRCGNAVEQQASYGQVRPVCPSCGWIHFADPKVAVGVFVEKDGKILLVQHVDVHDPAYAPGLTVKRYRSEKVVDPVTGEWRHEAITLEPLNTAHPPIELKLAQEGELRTVAEFVEVLRGTS